jgi:hypothetical protein
MELCPAHQFTAVGSCTRCGQFICEQCRRWLSERPFCAECLRRLGDKPSREAVIVLLLATVGLLLPVLGPFAIVLARRELKRVDTGLAPSAGRDFSALARTLGIFEVLMTLLVLLFLALR